MDIANNSGIGARRYSPFGLTVAAAILLTATSGPAFANGTLTTLASFDRANGSYPEGGVMLSGNTVYGTATGGGAYGDGAIFSVPTTGGNPTLIGSFNGVNGSAPYGSLAMSGGFLYGTTYSGGSYRSGTIFIDGLTGGTQ